MKTRKRLIGILTAVILITTLCVPVVLAEGDELWTVASDWFVDELSEVGRDELYPSALHDVDLTKPITRVEFAAVVVKLYETLNEKAIEPAPDTTFDDTQDEDVLKAFAAGIVGGTSPGKFSPDSLLIREQAAAMLSRVYKSIKWEDWTLEDDANYITHVLDIAAAPDFEDDNLISDWAFGSMRFMAKYELIRGSGNKANPKGNMSREQALIISQRMHSKWDDIEDGVTGTE